MVTYVTLDMTEGLDITIVITQFKSTYFYSFCFNTLYDRGNNASLYGLKQHQDAFDDKYTENDIVILLGWLSTISNNNVRMPESVLCWSKSFCEQSQPTPSA